ncbi:ABC transporter ATP-binding protein [Desulfitobacterium sp. Sab5]|uniref:ABC transporter ATP-binding protein n=1 Tax=Desulfitobacterium nosdiversum TaxID=3375356 RepID=UPI003CF54078
MITVENLSKIYQDKNQTVKAFENINLEVAQGDFLIFTGRSGSGKTTLISVMGGLTRPTTGKVLMDGIDLWTLSEPELARVRNEKFGFIFQFASLIPTLRVIDNLLLPLSFGGKRPTLEDQNRARQLLETVEISDKEQSFPSQLSGGQQRRVAIARSLINKPDVLFIDEPTGDLDEKTEQAIMQLFKKINEQGTTIVMVTHALDYAHIGNKVMTMRNGVLTPYEKGGELI